MSSIREIYPEFYKKFVCTASECPDTCCKDWDVVIDDESAEFYESVSGEFGNRLRQSMKIDDDGDRVFVFKNGVCPFLNSRRLCEIQVRYGEEHICDTCRAFPRISQDYTEFVEYMLSLACPEATRIILSDNNTFDCFGDFRVQNTDNGYSTEFMNFLLKARKITVNIFNTKDMPFTEQLKICLLFTEYVQNMIDEEIFDENRLGEFVYQETIADYKDRNFVFSMHRHLDIMDKQWLDELCDSADCLLNATSETDSEFQHLALYYIYRYYLNAIDSYDVITTAKRIYCAYIVISAMISKQTAENNFHKRGLLMQKYSKEVEHSYENTDFLYDEFMFNPDFSTNNLISTL